MVKGWPKIAGLAIYRVIILDSFETRVFAGIILCLMIY